MKPPSNFLLFGRYVGIYHIPVRDPFGLCPTSNGTRFGHSELPPHKRGSSGSRFRSSVKANNWTPRSPTLTGDHLSSPVSTTTCSTLRVLSGQRVSRLLRAQLFGPGEVLTSGPVPRAPVGLVWADLSSAAESHSKPTDDPGWLRASPGPRPKKQI